tara:strand:+ start:106 stop:492 length:387 start_codon:yes stop_codon:yes gene_type:complete
MKKVILLIITLTILADLSYASFPVSSKKEIKCSENLNYEDITSESDTPIFGILSISLAVLSVFLLGNYDYWTLSLIFAIFAVIFGALGFNNKLRGLAITGFIIGLLELLYSLVMYSFIFLAMSASNNL